MPKPGIFVTSGASLPHSGHFPPTTGSAFGRPTSGSLPGAQSRAADKDSYSILIPAVASIDPAHAQPVGVSPKSLIYGVDGAAYRTRTCDPIITNDVLYQLS